MGEGGRKGYGREEVVWEELKKGLWSCGTERLLDWVAGCCFYCDKETKKYTLIYCSEKTKETKKREKQAVSVIH